MPEKPIITTASQTSTKMELTKEELIYINCGSLIHIIQQIEKGMAILSIAGKNITQNRGKELYFHKSQLTFGELKTSLSDRTIFSEEEWKVLDKFNEDRNELVHNFFWDRSVEMAQISQLDRIQSELEVMKSSFLIVRGLIYEKIDCFIHDKSLLEKSRSKLLEDGVTPKVEIFRKLRKDEIIIDIVKCELGTPMQTIIFLLADNTYWTLCESGLKQCNENIALSSCERYTELNGVLPIKNFNPKPQNMIDDWHYDLLLKVKSLQIEVRPTKKQDSKVVSCSVRMVSKQGFSKK